MGAVGAIVLAVIRHPQLGRPGRMSFIVGVAGAGIAVLIGSIAFKSLPFRVAIGAMYVALAYLLVRAAQLPDLRGLIVQAFQSTMRITAMVAFILIGSTCFAVVFQGVNGGVWIEHLLAELPGGAWGFLAFINVFVFFLAFFLDYFEIAFIIVPMLAPVAQKLLEPVVGADAALIWFGVLLCVNMQTSFMHPPFGFALFYLRSVAPKEIRSADIYWGALPFVAMQVLLVAVVIAFPSLVTWPLSKPYTIDPSKVQIELRAPAADDEEESAPVVIAPR
jgi:TRAP-type mannitol/chloroaromatic compound transport system permease large subunit